MLGSRSNSIKVAMNKAEVAVLICLFACHCLSNEIVSVVRRVRGLSCLQLYLQPSEECLVHGRNSGNNCQVNSRLKETLWELTSVMSSMKGEEQGVLGVA